MTPSPLPDPLEMWRQAVSKFEGEFNSMAGSTANSAQFAQLMQQFGGASRGLQQAVEKALGHTYQCLNLASGQEIGALAEALQRIEAKLDQLLTAQVPAPGGPRPARTRRPPGEAAATTAPTTPATPPPSLRTNRTQRTSKKKV